jgi:hypothetical protein
MHGVKVTGVRPENGVTPYYGTFIIVSVADPGCLSRIRLYPSRIPDPDADFLPIPDPGSRGQKGTGSRIRNTELYKERRREILWKELTPSPQLCHTGKATFQCSKKKETF